MNKHYSWQGGTSTAFGVAANWFDVTDGITAASPPGAGDFVVLNGAGTIDGTATGLASLTVSATSGAGYEIGATLGVSDLDVEGRLALSSGATLTADTVNVDDGTLLLQDGSFLNAANQALAITVSGSGTGAASSVLQVASGGFLYVGTGAIDVGVGTGQSGTLLVTGGTLFADVPFDSPGSVLAIGTQGATGSVAVGSGGAIVQCAVDVGVSGHGLLSLGVGAQLTAFNFDGGPALALGMTAQGAASPGQGTIVSLGATISTGGGDTIIGDTGQGDLVAGGGTLSAGGVTLGLALGASGTLAVGADETWDAGFVMIGDAGNGTVQMTAFAAGSGSGTVGYLSIGTAGGSGTLAISHETLHIQDFAEMGRGGGTNAITVGAGGVWDGVGQNLFLDASTAGGGNTLDVAGAGSMFDAGSLFGFAGTQIRFGAGAHAAIGDNPATDAFGTAGGTIAVTDADLTVGALMGVRTEGTMTISGSSSVSANGGLLVFDSGTIAIDGGVVHASSASGTAVQVNDGGTLAVSGGALNTVGEFLIGDAAGSGGPRGTFTASAGALVTSTSTAGNAVVVGSAGYADTASVTGARWTVDGNMAVQLGSVSLLDAAALNVSGTLTLGFVGTFGSGANLFETGSTVTTADLHMLFGTLAVGSGSTLIAGTAAGGEVFSIGGSAVIDDSHVLVQGQADLQGALTVSGDGTLSVTNGGTASAGAALTLHQFGSLTITDAGTSLKLGGGLLDTQGGDIAIQAGAQVSVISAAPNVLPGFSVGGGDLGSPFGTATIDGLGTVLHVTGQMLIGTTGAGMLAIGDGAEVDVSNVAGQTVPGAVVGSAGGYISEASVTGGAHWTVTGALDVAPQGFAGLDLSGNGTVSAGSVSIGGTAASHGSLSLAGSGDVLTTQLLTVGTAGTVTLGAGSHLSAGGLLVGMAGQGVATPHAATIDIAGGKLSVFGGAFVHGGVVLSQGGTLAVSNGLTLAAGSTIIGQGVLGAGNIVDLGRIGCSGGTMTCLGPVSGTGLLSVANGGDLTLAHGESSTVGLVFGAYGTFTAAGVGLISGTITGWTTGDTLDFTNVHVASDSLSGHVLTLFDGAGTVLGRETFAGTFTSNNFSLSADHGAGTVLGFHA